MLFIYLFIFLCAITRLPYVSMPVRRLSGTCQTIDACNQATVETAHPHIPANPFTYFTLPPPLSRPGDGTPWKFKGDAPRRSRLHIFMGDSPTHGPRPTSIVTNPEFLPLIFNFAPVRRTNASSQCCRASTANFLRARTPEISSWSPASLRHGIHHGGNISALPAEGTKGEREGVSSPVQGFVV